METDRFSDDLAPNLIDEGVLTAADLEDEPTDEQPPQLFEPDDPFGPDTEASMVAESGLDPADSVPAEEAAMRVEDEPAGMNYDETPGYLD
ncbi:MAG TPA: hypothetical protein VNA57_13760 [Acidimicrobiales bacterium]|nr:hypothetical protein [Acidimicrobiales bacterium]